MTAIQLLQQVSFANLYAIGGWRSIWDLIPEGLRLIFPLTFFLIQLLVMSGVLYLAGLLVVGGKRARFSDAFLISLLGTVFSTLFFMFIPYPLLAWLPSILVWLLLIKRFYETGWFGAIAVGLLSMVIFLAVAIILALFFGVFEAIMEKLFMSFTLFFGSG